MTEEAGTAGSLTLAELRDQIGAGIRKLAGDIFGSLRGAHTESLTTYLVALGTGPIVAAYLQDEQAAQPLLKKIWTERYAVAERYISQAPPNPEEIAPFVQTILGREHAAACVFEDLLIFVEAVSLFEEQFHSQEWVLQELRRELREWHRRGGFQRIEVTIPSEQFAPPVTSRGDLQIQVSASKPTIVAGQEFSVFVVIDNPFEVPIVLYSVETQIPVELVDVAARQLRRASLTEEASFSRPDTGLANNLLRLTWDRWRMNLRMAMEPESRIAQAIASTETVDRRKQISVMVSQQVETMGERSNVIGAQIEHYQSVDIAIDSASPQHLDSLLWRIEAFRRGVIPIVLQPGDSVVKQFILSTKSWLLFTPLAHTLEIQMRYGVDDRDHLDTIRYELTIQAAITATMTGAILGGAVGALARMLGAMQAGPVQVGTQLLSLLLAVILSAITVVSFARKSGVQQIISIEDFWGGLFLGFLVGFLGQSYATSLIAPSGTAGAPTVR
jgi:hypothetical protein